LKKASKHAAGRRGQVIGTYPQFKGQNSLTGVFKLLSSGSPPPEPGAAGFWQHSGVFGREF
jgi:hypothetical protein